MKHVLTISMRMVHVILVSVVRLLSIVPRQVDWRSELGAKKSIDGSREG